MPSSKLILSAFVLSTLSLSACSLFSGDAEEPPLPGERISILELQRELTPSQISNPEDVIIIPDAVPNNSWPQNGGNANHVMQNLFIAGTKQFERIWAADIGEGSQKNLPLVTRPIVAAGKVFTLDTESRVRAFHDQTGRQVWQSKIRALKEDEPVIGGGLAYDNGTLFATSGYNEVLALNPENGDIIWRTTISAGSRAAPTVKDGRVFVTASNNNAIALNADDGRIIWEYEGVDETTGLLGAASPATDGQIVIPAFSSGNIVALRVENGSVLWSDSLASSLRLGGMAGLSEIRGLPIISGDIVLAVSFGGKMAAYDKRNGAILWQADISSAETPWVAGNTVYVLGAEYKLLAYSLRTGELLWASDLQKFRDRQDREGLITWTGPIMAGGSLLIVGSHGRVKEFNPKNGSQIAEWDMKKEVRIPPIVADGALYLLSEDGSLLAYR